MPISITPFPSLSSEVSELSLITRDLCMYCIHTVGSTNRWTSGIREGGKIYIIYMIYIYIYHFVGCLLLSWVIKSQFEFEQVRQEEAKEGEVAQRSAWGPRRRDATVNRAACTCWSLNLKSFHRRTTGYNVPGSHGQKVLSFAHSQHQYYTRYSFPRDRIMDTEKKKSFRGHWN